MSKSYFPGDRTGQIAWHNNFANEFPNIANRLGFTDAEITNAVNDSKYAAYLLGMLGPEVDSETNRAAEAVLDGQASGQFVDFRTGSDAPIAVRPGIDTRRQARVERIKRFGSFNDAIAKQLKIATDKIDPKSYKAELGIPRRTGNYVTIPFRKAGGNVSGINLYRQCKGESAPKHVGFYFRTPAIDTTATRSGKPEKCEYTARAVVHDKEIGQFSDAVSISG